MTILEKTIQDDQWLEIILAITYIKNICSTKTLERNNTPHYAQY